MMVWTLKRALGEGDLRGGEEEEDGEEARWLCLGLGWGVRKGATSGGVR